MFEAKRETNSHLVTKTGGSVTTGRAWCSLSPGHPTSTILQSSEHSLQKSRANGSLCFKYPAFLEQVLFRNTFQWPIPAGGVFKHFTSRMQSLWAFCSWLEAISSRGRGRKKNISTATFFYAAWNRTLEKPFAWKLQANRSVHNMQRCFKIFWGYFPLLVCQHLFCGGKIVWSSCSGKGKLNDHTPGASKAAGQRVGRPVQSHCLGVGKAQVCFLACLVFVRALSWVCLQRCILFNQKWKRKKKKTFPYKCLITSVCSTELFCNKVCKGKINFFFFFFGYKTE